MGLDLTPRFQQWQAPPSEPARRPYHSNSKNLPTAWVLTARLLEQASAGLAVCGGAPRRPQGTRCAGANRAGRAEPAPPAETATGHPPTWGKEDSTAERRAEASPGGCPAEQGRARRTKAERDHAHGAGPQPEAAGWRAGPSPRQRDPLRRAFQKARIRELRVGREAGGEGRGAPKTVRGEGPGPPGPDVCPAPLWVVFLMRVDPRA